MEHLKLEMARLVRSLECVRWPRIASDGALSCR